MPSRKVLRSGLLMSLLALLAACGGGGGSTHRPSTPKTNIDLAVSGFSVSPVAADPEDSLSLSGTIQNLGTETANPNPGDKFRVRFNLSTDGTFELNEQGFMDLIITDPIPGGGSLPFQCVPPACVTSYGTGDTLSTFGNFCNCATPDCCSTQTQSGVIGVRVDGANEINELQEGNNFAFKPIEVDGTRVGATFTGCDVGTLNSSSGCDLSVTDGLTTLQVHRPCVGCPSTDIVMPNELHNAIDGFITITGCTNAQTSGGGSCGASWMVTAVTEKPGVPASTRQALWQCIASYPGGFPTKVCPFHFDIRDPSY
jgi:hypothetical protein